MRIIIAKLSTQFQRTPYLVFLVAVFCTTAAIALIIQLVVLPYLFPELHAGNGLLAGGDSVGFHRTAAWVAERIRSEGWSA